MIFLLWWGATLGIAIFIYFFLKPYILKHYMLWRVKRITKRARKIFSTDPELNDNISKVLDEVDEFVDDKRKQIKL